MADALRWESESGKVRWQPALDTGEVSMWKVHSPRVQWQEWLAPGEDVEEPSLHTFPLRYRSKRRAIRVAAREERRRYTQVYKPV